NPSDQTIRFFSDILGCTSCRRCSSASVGNGYGYRILAYLHRHTALGEQLQQRFLGHSDDGAPAARADVAVGSNDAQKAGVRRQRKVERRFLTRKQGALIAHDEGWAESGLLVVEKGEEACVVELGVTLQLIDPHDHR